MKHVMFVVLAALFMTTVTAAYAQSVTLRACNSTTVVTGGVAVTAISGASNGYYIFNPTSATDQGIGAAEALYIDPTASATTTGNGTNSAISAGQPFLSNIPSKNSISVNAASSGHKFSCVRW